MATLQKDWVFNSSPITIKTRLSRLRRNLVKKRAFPEWEVLLEPVPAPRWIVYFIYSPTGGISIAHNFTLDRLIREKAKLLIVATGLATAEISRLTNIADAIIIKDKDGYDFSAYAIALDALAFRSPGADIFFLNDSILGPFSSLEKLVWKAPWDFTGMLASAECENHIQSFAFSIRNCTRGRIKTLHPLFTLSYSFNDFGDVVALKETQMARLASKSMSVGARWFSPPDFAINASMQRPLDLITAGFPFLKKANLEKHAFLHDQSQLQEFLKNIGHPPISTVL